MANVLTQTTITVTINGKNYTQYVQFPFKVSNLLDEQLDEASLTLIGVPDKIFKPLTAVTVTVKNGTKTQTYSMLVADDKADEIPSGSRKYKHELYLIEQTKFLECFVVRSLGYVNPLMKSYEKIDSVPTIKVTQQSGTNYSFQPSFYYQTPLQVGEFITLKSIDNNFITNTTGTMEIYDEGSFLAKTTVSLNGVLLKTINGVRQGDTQFELSEVGTYVIEYSNFDCELGLFWMKDISVTYFVVVVDDQSSPQKWNARTVIRRALEAVETLRKGESPRFRLEGDIGHVYQGDSIEFLGDFETLADLRSAYPTTTIGNLAWVKTIPSSYPNGANCRFNANGWVVHNSVYPLSGTALWLQSIETPEFQFTQSTFREVLQEVGRYLHAEPRLINGDTITFDKLGSGEISPFDANGYASKSFQQGIDRYATNLHSTVNNFVNSINYANGVLVEPYNNGLKTVRTEDVYVRLEDTNVHISTLYPIRAIKKLECGLAEGFATEIANEGGFVDITPFVYESAEYQRMSSYEGAYPMAKAWALYYTIGQNGVYGLNFKEETAMFEAFKRYAIVNILNAVTRRSVQTDTNMVKLAFRITYEPIYSATAQQSKSYIGDLDVPATMVYNQAQNLVESHYYGENMKGAIARLGNVDKVLTYVKNGLFIPPQVGQILLDGNDEYYISAVATEFFPFYTKFSMSLSKDFNRYSDYVKVNSEKRLYEVSERQAFDSHITYKDYVVIGDSTKYSVSNDGLISQDAVEDIFTQSVIDNPLSLCEIQGFDRLENTLQKVALPVQKTALGNSALFTIKYKDNYSAGDNVVLDGNYWQNGVSYCDYFGNIEYLGFTMRIDGKKPTDLAEQTEIGMALPIYDFPDDASDQYITTKRGEKLWVKKGSTEIPTIDYQVDFVTNLPNIIIGSGLAKNLPLISGRNTAPKLYLLNNRLNKFENKVDISNGTLWDFSLQNGEFIASGVLSDSFNAWAIVDGDTSELLIGCNKAITNVSQIFDGLKIFIKHDIFKDKI